MEAVAADSPVPNEGDSVKPDPTDSTAYKQFVTFTLGDLEYGVDIMAVREIRGWRPTTRIPNAPAHMRGVTNLRGVIVPNYDLRSKFSMGETEPTSSNVVVLVAVGSRVIGILVDSVSDILTIPSSEISAVPAGSQPGRDQWLSGLTTTEGRMVSILDLDALFGREEAVDVGDKA